MPSGRAAQSDALVPSRHEDPFRAGTIKRIHVNQHVIRRNAKTGETAPPLSVKTSKGSTPCDGVVIHGDSVVRYSPETPLSCGARVWIETRARLTLCGVEFDPEGSR